MIKNLFIVVNIFISFSLFSADASKKIVYKLELDEITQQNLPEFPFEEVLKTKKLPGYDKEGMLQQTVIHLLKYAKTCSTIDDRVGYLALFYALLAQEGDEFLKVPFIERMVEIYKRIKKEYDELGAKVREFNSLTKWAALALARSISRHSGTLFEEKLNEYRNFLEQLESEAEGDAEYLQENDSSSSETDIEEQISLLEEPLEHDDTSSSQPKKQISRKRKRVDEEESAKEQAPPKKKARSKEREDTETRADVIKRIIIRLKLDHNETKNSYWGEIAEKVLAAANIGFSEIKLATLPRYLGEIIWSNEEKEEESAAKKLRAYAQNPNLPRLVSKEIRMVKLKEILEDLNLNNNSIKTTDYWRTHVQKISKKLSDSCGDDIQYNALGRYFEAFEKESTQPQDISLYRQLKTQAYNLGNKQKNSSPLTRKAEDRLKAVRAIVPKNYEKLDEESWEKLAKKMAKRFNLKMGGVATSFSNLANNINVEEDDLFSCDKIRLAAQRLETREKTARKKARND